MADVTSPGTLALHLLDVGQGEAIIIDFPDNTFGLIDSGPKVNPELVLRYIELRLTKGRKFRFAAVTQWDRDHAAGMPIVLKKYEPEVFYTPGIDLTLLEQLAGDEGAPIVEAARKACGGVVEEKRINARDVLSTPDGVVLVALSPNGGLAEEIRSRLRPGMSSAKIKLLRNRTSLVLWMSFCGTTLFLGGEIESDQYEDIEYLWHARHDPLSKYGPPQADWIKLSHHGADGNNPIRLFQSFARNGKFVASASAGGRYGHPHPVTLSRLPDGGQAMCTRLGAGCALIIRDKLDPRRPDNWLDKYPPLLQYNPRTSCFGTVTVEVVPTNSGRSTCTVRGASIQPVCPYGGPPGGYVSLT